MSIDEQIDAVSYELAQLPGWVKFCSIEISCVDPDVVAARGMFQKLEQLYKDKNTTKKFLEQADSK